MPSDIPTPETASSELPAGLADSELTNNEVAATGTTAQSSPPAVAIQTEKLEGRRRRIVASISVPCAVDQVWQVITDYDNLSQFIPNLTVSRRVPHDGEGIRLEQVGTQCFLNVKFCARVVLDMVERFPQEVAFSMVEGDFRLFEGVWRLQPGDDDTTTLIYDLVLLPPRAMPAGLIERHIRHDLTQNLSALCQCAVARFA